MRHFYLHKRAGIWYAEIVDQATGKKLSARSTGARDRDEAILVIGEWRKNGIPTCRQRKLRPIETAASLESILRAIRKTDLLSEDAMLIVSALKERGLIDISAEKNSRNSIMFSEFLQTFWDYNTSPYVKDKLAHKQSIGKRHCYDMRHRIRIYWLPVFKYRALSSITKQDLKTFSLELADKGLASSSVNKIMVSGNVALAWAFREGIIPADPTEGFMRFSGTPEKRGVLTPQETAKIFSVQWEDERAYVASLLACTCGLRSGEVRAIRKSDIGENILHVRHAWSDFDLIKAPKNGEVRKVPLLPEVKEKLLKLLAENPYRSVDRYGSNDPFVFFSLLKDKPLDSKVLLKGLKKACAAAGINCEERGIVFHSFRHYWAARMADHMEAEKLSRVTGHKSRAIFDHYANHIIDENLEEIGKIGAKVFGKILPSKTA